MNQCLIFLTYLCLLTCIFAYTYLYNAININYRIPTTATKSNQDKSWLCTVSSWALVLAHVVSVNSVFLSTLHCSMSVMFTSRWSCGCRLHLPTHAQTAAGLPRQCSVDANSVTFINDNTLSNMYDDAW